MPTKTLIEFTRLPKHLKGTRSSDKPGMDKLDEKMFVISEKCNQVE